MENEIRNVRLSYCCKKDWNSFTRIDERTRHCDSCQHEVVDFTEATQSEFDQAMNSGKKVCGRFKQSQMNESFLKLAAASLVVAASASCSQEKSEPPPRLTNTYESQNSRILMGIPPPPHNINDSTNLFVIPKIIPDPQSKR